MSARTDKREIGDMFNIVFNLSMIGLGALGGSAVSLVFGLTGGVVGAVSFAVIFGVLSIIAERRSKQKKITKKCVKL